MQVIPWVSEVTGQAAFSVNDALDAFDALIRDSNIKKPVRVFSLGAYRVRRVGHGFLYVTNLNEAEICSKSPGWQTAFSCTDLGVPFTYAIFFCRNYQGMKYVETLQLRESLFHLIYAVNYLKESKLFSLIDDECHWMDLAHKDLWFGHRYLGLVAFQTTCGRKMTLAHYKALQESSCFLYFAEICSDDFEELPSVREIRKNGHHIFVVSRQMAGLLKKQIGYPKFNIWFSDATTAPVYGLSVVQARRSARGHGKLKNIPQVVEEINKGYLTVSAGCSLLLQTMRYSSCLTSCNNKACRKSQFAQMEMHLLRLVSTMKEEEDTECEKPSQFEYLSPSECVRRKMEEFLKINSSHKSYPDRILKCE